MRRLVTLSCLVLVCAACSSTTTSSGTAATDTVTASAGPGGTDDNGTVSDSTGTGTGTGTGSTDTGGEAGDRTTTTHRTTTTTIPPTTTTTALWQRFPTYDVQPAIHAGQVRSFSRVDTTDPVVFLTIDDGIVRDQRVVDLLRERGAVATLFILPGPLYEDPDYFAQFVALGGTINSHSQTHLNLKGQPLEVQEREVCSGAAAIRSHYGFSGSWFRPPFGSYDENTAAAIAHCGLNAMMMWRVTCSEGIISTWGDSPINPGDIILLHFRPTLYEDLKLLFAELDRLGLSVARLEDYVTSD